ncbi:MAG TPA: SBBP repeat-containing protein [Bacteroidia bacterium]|nr:SBBP repeat-containing protein [Bacteroidia bacterium]
MNYTPSRNFFVFQLSVCIVLICSFVNTAGGQPNWFQKAGGSTNDEGYSISTDGSGNTYTTGYFSGTATFGPTVLTASGVSDAFVTKTDKNGNFKWTVKAGGAGSCRGLAIKADAAGNTYVTGYYYGSATFGTQTITSLGQQDVFIAKYTTAGALVWVTSAGGPMADIGNAITVDNSGNVLVTGQFAGTATFGTFSLTSTANSVNVFTTKLDGNGNFLWAEMGSGPHTNRGLGVGCDPAGNVYIMGQFTDTITFTNTHFSNLYDAIFLVKYNSAGVEQWFDMAGGGTLNIANGIAVDNSSDVYLTGNFTGTLSFFGAPTVTLTNKYANRIFVAKYSGNGKLLWDVSDGSSNPVTANAISLDASGNAYIIGNFECRMNSYADQYGQGTFNSVGSWDIFVAEYEVNAGAWQWSRQMGGHLDNLGYSIAVDGSGDIYTAGSFDEDMVVTGSVNYIGYGTSPVHCNTTYCSDIYYGSFQYVSTSGASDIFIAAPIDLSRQPYDFYDRTGGGCTRPVVGVVIDSINTDTVRFCSSGSVTAYSNTCAIAGPNYNYQWSTGAAGGSLTVNKTGWYYVTQTSQDGCFQSTDSIYAVVNPIPPIPNITDNLGININSQNPKPIKVCEKKVVLTGGGFGTDTYYWSGGGTNDSLKISADTSGQYCFKIADNLGCTNSVCVNVTFEDSLPAIKPGLTCIKCSHDSIAFCKGLSFTMFAFDSTSNPGINTAFCIPPGSGYVKNVWHISPDSASYSDSTFCPGTNSFTPRDSGWYTITDTIIRKNLCDSIISVVQDSVFVRIYPNPVDSNLSIKGNHLICPGDTTLLVATGTNFKWSPSGSTNDSIWVGTGGYVLSSKVTNQYGCSTSAITSFIVSAKTPPIINVTPANSVVCPGDSVQLTCSGKGQFQWQGPNGIIGTNDSSIYVTSSGAYYCVLSDTNLCTPVLSNTANVTAYSYPYLSTVNQIICPGDSARLYVVSSVGSTISWQPPLSGSDTSVEVTKAGTYTCRVTSCGIVTNCNITISVSTPLATITASPAEIFCAGDSVVLTANSGMSSYQWTPGSLNTQSITVKNPGTYTLVTLNSDGCLATANTTVVQTPAIIPQIIITPPLCNGDSGSIIIKTLTGGTSPYTYLWNTGNTSSGIRTLVGSYSVTITDSKGCAEVTDTTMVQPGVLVATVTSTNALCYNGYGSMSTAGTTGGTLPYFYMWSNGSTTSSISVVAGTDSVIVKDTNGCMASAKATITQPPQVVDSVVLLSRIVCNGDSTGSAKVIVSGGVPPYSYVWSSFTPQTTPTATGLPAGNYSVTVTDSNGCISTLSLSITQPAGVVTTAATPKAICIGQADTISATSTGGTPPYTYVWSTGVTSSSIIVNPVVTTTYAVISTLDSNKCPGIADTITVKVYPPLSVVTITPDTICPGATAVLNAKGSGGDGTYTYVWQAGNIIGDSVSVSPSTDTSFTVTLTDACNTPAVTGRVNIVIASTPVVKFTADSLSGCSPLCVTFTDNSTVAGGSVSSVLWSFGNGSVSGKSPVTYCYDSSSIYTVSLSVTSNDNCTASYTQPNMITVYSHPTAAFTTSPQQVTTVEPTIYFTNESTDAYGIISSLWRFNEAPFDAISNDSNTSYVYHDSGEFCPQLTVTNVHGCINTAIQCIDIEPLFTIYIPNAFSPNGDGLNDVFAPKGDYICDYEMYIFDRWGMTLYYTTDLSKGWDGTVFGSTNSVQEDTYIYLIKVTDCMEHNKHSYLGKVTVVK